MVGFNETINQLCLIEPSLSGQDFTWTNEWQSPSSVKPDTFLLSLEWEDNFPLLSARALQRPLSDHTHILLGTGDFPTKSHYFALRISGCHIIQSQLICVVLGFAGTFSPWSCCSTYLQAEALHFFLRQWSQTDFDVLIMPMELIQLRWHYISEAPTACWYAWIGLHSGYPLMDPEIAARKSHV